MVSIAVIRGVVFASVGKFPYCTVRLQHYLHAVAGLSNIVSEFICGCLLK